MKVYRWPICLCRLHARRKSDQLARRLSRKAAGTAWQDACRGRATCCGVAGPGAYSAEHALSERELEVLRLIVAGYSNHEIADRLVIAVSTVKWYVNAIYGKLQVESRTRAIARARELDIM